MQIIRYTQSGNVSWGAVQGQEVAPLPISESVERTRAGAAGVSTATLRAAAGEAIKKGERIPLSDLVLKAPIPAPSKIIAIGLNYADHIAESGLEAPEVPPVFAKFPSTLADPGSAVHRPRNSDSLDYEGELAIVIGTRCRHVPRDRAQEVVAGYSVFNDFSVREWQIRSQQWTIAKSFDTHSAIGPSLTLASDVDPSDLTLRTWVNGELRQSSSTRHLVFDCAALIEHLSEACTLEPGDVIATGTPAGVGAAMTPPKYLEPGDTVRVEIEGLGVLENEIVEEPASTAHIGDELLTPSAAGT